MRTGIRLGIDVGKARVGVARSDLHGLLATPLETVAREPQAAAVARILSIAEELEAVECVVGLPLSLSGTRTPSTEDAETFAQLLADAAGAVFTVRLVDERLSTVTAQSQLRQSGKNAKSSRSIIDQQAAVIILQHALDLERSLSTPPGSLVVQGAMPNHPGRPID